MRAATCAELPCCSALPHGVDHDCAPDEAPMNGFWISRPSISVPLCISQHKFNFKYGASLLLQDDCWRLLITLARSAPVTYTGQLVYSGHVRASRLTIVRHLY
jgi:hypothetical protein